MTLFISILRISAYPMILLKFRSDLHVNLLALHPRYLGCQAEYYNTFLHIRVAKQRVLRLLPGRTETFQISISKHTNEAKYKMEYQYIIIPILKLVID